MVALLVLLAGTSSAVLASRSIANNAADQERRSFRTTAAEIASTLQLALQHEQDLVVSASGFVTGNPRAGQTQFQQWVTSIGAMQRYPELLYLLWGSIVPSAQLPAFEASAVKDPAGPLGPGGKFQVVPPGSRPYYCLSRALQLRAGEPPLPAGLDLCATGQGPVALSARDSGLSVYLPYPLGPLTALAVATPIYQVGAPLATVAERRAAFVGEVGMFIQPQDVLLRALQGHPGVALSLSYHDFGSAAAFDSGKIPKHAQVVTTSLDNGWKVQSFGAISAEGAFANGAALSVLLAGVATSVLLSVLILALATGRARAVALVRLKTDELRHQALHDALTGLPNRALITDRVEQLLARNRRHGTAGAALYIDLDGFKNVNDTFGHGAGDNLLRAVAARLNETLRDADTIGRMGGDEFVVLVDGASSVNAPALAAERILNVIRQPFHLEGVASPIVVTTSIGIAEGDRATPDDLLRDADMALYQAKAAGKNALEVFHSEMGEEIQRRHELEFDLRNALENDQFRLVYQPIYDLEDLSPVAVEALLRWDLPGRGEIGPNDFIPLLEANGQIIEVGRWVLQQSCRQMKAWHDVGVDLKMSVNVSGRQLDRDGIVDDVRSALETSGLDPAALTIEVTETALMRNVEATSRRLTQLKALGVQVAIDDFGTGYSSLAYLQRFPVDCLKIDRTFTDAVGRSPESDALIHTLVQLGRDLGLQTLAEGVETGQQVDHLRDEQVNQIQGFLLSRALPPEVLESQLLTLGLQHAAPTGVDSHASGRSQTS